MKKLSAFADTLISTDRRGGLLPFSSGQGEGSNFLPLEAGSRVLAFSFVPQAPEGPKIMVQDHYVIR